MIRQSNLISTFICLTAIFIQGCSQRELCYDHTHGAIVDIEFDWSLEPDAHPSDHRWCGHSPQGEAQARGRSSPV